MQLANYAQINDGRVDKIDKRTENLEKNMHTMMGVLQHISIGIQQHMQMGTVFIMDATGRQHSVPMHMARSFDVRLCGTYRELPLVLMQSYNIQQFKAAIRVLFWSDTVQGRLLCRYMDIEGYDLGIDDGRQLLQITNDAEWSRVQPGTTIVMSIILSKPRVRQREYLCPFCKVWNEVDEISGRSALDW